MKTPIIRQLLFWAAALAAGLLATVSAKPTQAYYEVWGGEELLLGEDFLLYYDVNKIGWTKLGSATGTKTFTGRYNYYCVVVKRDDLYLDAVMTSDGSYYERGVPCGNIEQETHYNYLGPPDQKYLVLAGSAAGNAATSTYGSFAIFDNTASCRYAGDWTSMTFHVYSPPPKPKAPAGMKLKALSSKSIRVCWADRSDNETGFVIERAAARKGPWRRFAKVGAGVTCHDCKGLKPGTRYFFRVKAVNGPSGSAPTRAQSARTSGSAANALSQLVFPSKP